MREVKAKRKHWRDESRKKFGEFRQAMIPVILEGVKEMAVTVIAILSKLDQDFSVAAPESSQLVTS